ncbi:MAG: methyltransferase domain-containing protein [Planctomycetaceae bacterium]|nr:methyltransferase domain-containing protein [Planctomycetaceae bacterium]
MLWPNQLRALTRLTERHREAELMDEPSLNVSEHARALMGLRRVNWWSRSAAMVQPALQRLAVGYSAKRPLRLLDVACGGGDVTAAIARWTRLAGLPVRFSACDISPTALDVARHQAVSAGESIEFFQHDLLQQPLPAEFDVVICSLFLHHLDEPDAVRVLRSMADAAARAILVNDLIRSRQGYLLAMFGTRLLSRSRIVHVDGPLSVAGAFTSQEALRLCEQAGLHGATISRHWPQRFLLTWRRP